MINKNLVKIQHFIDLTLGVLGEKDKKPVMKVCLHIEPCTEDVQNSLVLSHSHRCCSDFFPGKENPWIFHSSVLPCTDMACHTGCCGAVHLLCI